MSARPRTSQPRRARVRTSVAVAVGALALALVPAGVASAHVRVDPASTAAEGWTTMTFRVPNESEAASTTKVVVDLPTDTPLLSVSTKPVPGWTAKVETGALPTPVETDEGTVKEAPLHVVWTADEDGAIAHGEFQEFEISAGPLPAEGTDLELPAHQTYSDGRVVDWDQTATGDEEPDYPVPAFTVTAAAAEGHHGAAATDDPAADAAGHDHESAEASDDEDSSDTVARVLGGVGLVLGLAALVVAVATRRRPTA